ncbi:MAG: hypothetical protein OXM55_05700 [Bdellovibrionales bacterium]|nr:hypothetical protein [Bdellovibrionales bacterium]
MSLKSPKKKTGQKGRKKNKGQAIIEYVLILTVVVVVMGGMLLKFNKAFKDWAKSILGNQGYIACLMQTGTLPGKAHSSCTISNFDVNLSTSASSTGASSGGSSSSGSSSGSSSSSTSSDTPIGGGGDISHSDQGKPSPTTEDIGDSSSGDHNSSVKTGSSSKKGNKEHSPSGQMISLNSNSGSKWENLPGADENAGEGGSTRAKRKKRKMGFRENMSPTQGKPGYSGKRFRAVKSYGYMLTDEKEQKKRSAPIAVGSIGSKKKNTGGKEKTNYMKINKKLKTKDQGPKIGKWSFGNIFRLFLIICIIVAVVLIIGSQATQVKKSMK